MITRACEDIIESWSTLNPHLSDHSAIHSKLSLARARPPKVKKQYRKIRGVDPIEFRNDVMASTLFSSPACNVNDLCDQYDSELSKVVDVHAPLKTRLVTSRPSAPWYSEEIAAEKRKRRKLERRWRKSGTEADKLQYSDQCSRVRKLLKSSKMSYYASLINENKSDSKVLFNTIDRMLHRTPQNHYPSCGSPKELCDKFADFFCDKIVTIRNQLDTLSTTDAPAFPLIDDAIITCELSEFSPTSEDELSGLAKKIAAKSCSLDPVPASLLRYCIDDILPIIKSVVNLSFNSASMPISMKNAVLSPLLKKPSLDFEIFSNFRPVSNLKFLSKVIEKVAAMRLTNYLCDNDLNESLQSAYKKHHSCETALLRVQNDILKSIDDKQCVVLLLLDLSAAFDTVDHKILLHTLRSRFGIKGKALSWLQSYLTDRSQSVQIDGFTSSVRPLRFGVPQGSVLGPLLYLLYTAPLGDLIRWHDMDFHLYADDTQLYTTFSCDDKDDLTTTISQIESCLVDITNWMTTNKLKLNTDKTELLILYSRFRLPPRLPSIKIGTDIIKPTNKARNIGVIFDNTVTMSFHINNIVKVAFYHLRNIAKIRKYINVTTAEVLVHAFINSKLDFCNSLLHGLPKYEINKLQSVQNAAARVIACLSKFDHISDTLKELHWLPVEQRIIFKINLICFKILNNLAPDYLVDLIHVYEPARYLRSSSDKWRLKIKPYNLKTYGFRAFSVIAPILWNDLPVDIRSIDDVNKFKSKLKTFLFKRVYELS